MSIKENIKEELEQDYVQTDYDVELPQYDPENTIAAKLGKKFKNFLGNNM